MCKSRVVGSSLIGREIWLLLVINKTSTFGEALLELLWKNLAELPVQC